MFSRMRSCKGTVEGRAPRTPAQALHWSNHLTALLSQLPNYGWKENTRNYVKPTLTANLSSEHVCSTWAMLPDCGSQSRSGKVPFMALVPGFAVTFQACSIHELPACPGPVQPKPLEFGVIRPKRRTMRYAEASSLGLCPRKRNSCLQVDIGMQHNGGPQVWSKKCRFFEAPEPVPGDVRCCTHTAGKRFSSQRYRANTQLAANMSEPV